MSADTPNLAPGPPQDGGFGAIRQALEDQAHAFREGLAEGQSLKVENIHALHQTASRDILALLEERGVERAAALSAKLAEETAETPATDMITIAGEYEAERSTGNLITDEAELEKLSQLARVVGSTAHAAVDKALGGTRTSQSIQAAREMMMQQSLLIGDQATDVTDALLDDIEMAEPEAQPGA